MRLPNSAHSARPWRIHELTHDFRLEDAWALPTKGGVQDFSRLVDLWVSYDPSQSSAPAVRTLSALRLQLGRLLRWDGPGSGLDGRVATLRDRMPPDLRAAPRGPDFPFLPFSPLYLLEDEFAAEAANHTMHGVVHLAWVPDEHGGYRGQMAILVKPNGVFGNAYMTAIKPFRHLLVYPAAMRELARSWERPDGRPAHADM